MDILGSGKILANRWVEQETAVAVGLFGVECSEWVEEEDKENNEKRHHEFESVSVSNSLFICLSLS